MRTPTTDDLERAVQVVRRYLRPTPLEEGLEPSEPLLKLESMQPTGSFKVRGAINALTNVDPDTPVVTASAGNHGLGMAYAARRLGRPITVVVSTKASPAKVEALRRLGTEPVQIGTTIEHAEAHAMELAQSGAHYVSPYNDPDVIAGQGTIGVELTDQMVELADQADGPLTVVSPIGGGGLTSGLGLWASTRPDVRLVGVESALSTPVSTAIRAGRWAEIEIGPTIADGLSGNVERGSVTLELIGRHADQLLTVSEAEIRDAMRWLASRRGLVAEGAGATALAAVLAQKVDAEGRIVALVSGRNIALPLYAAQLA
ncbi:MAG TPA: pyridoxal-phosphate dependent enzyme [Nocardioidaceae bacterium]|nr:pyridoxal-phosphate dependent enzyme [Nocardioidaceae bacterium]